MVKRILRDAYVYLILLVLYAPILLLVVYSFNMSKEIGIWSKEWGFSLYADLFKNRRRYAHRYKHLCFVDRRVRFVYYFRDYRRDRNVLL